MKRAIAAVLACASASCFAQDLPTVNIDFEAKGQPLGYAMERLGEKVDVQFDVGPVLSDEIVVIIVDGVSLSELMEQVANAVHGQWSKTRRGYMLERPRELQLKLRDASLARRAKAVRDYLGQFERSLREPFGASDAEALFRQIAISHKRVERDPRDVTAQAALPELFATGPAARLAHRLLSTIEREDLASLEFGERRVYSLSPTALQSGFGAGAEEAFDSFVKEQQIWTAASTAQEAYQRTANDPSNQLDAIEQSPVGWLIDARREGTENGLTARLLAWGPEGIRRVLYEAILPYGRHTAFVAGFAGAQVSFPDDFAGLKREFAEAAIARYRVKVPSISEEAKRFLMMPTDGDAGGLVASYMFARRFPERKIVAHLPDECLFVAPYLIASLGDTARFDHLLSEGLDVEVEQAAGWVLVRPNDPHLASHLRTPRAALERYLRSVEAQGWDSLASYAQLANEMVRPSAISAFAVRLLHLPSLRVDLASWHAVKLYGTLTDAQKLHITQGGAFEYASLTQAQRVAFVRLALSWDIDNMRSLGGTVLEADVGMNEPTTLLANGVPPDVSLSLGIFESPVVFGYAKSDDGYVLSQRGLPAANVAMFERMRRRSGSSTPRRGIPDSWAMGTRRRLEFKLQYAQDRWQMFQVIEEQPDRSAKPGPWQKLPPDVAGIIKEQLGGGSRDVRRVGRRANFAP